MGRVAVLVVSHSAQLAAGLVELAGQMAADVRIAGVGGTEDGRIGTSFDGVEAALTGLLAEDGVDGVVLVADLGSAAMTIDSVLELHDDEPVRHAEGPLVEGVVAAAVAAQGGDGLEEVAAAVTGAARSLAEAAVEPVGTAVPVRGDEAEAAPAESAAGQGGPSERETVVIEDPMGLHARPAAKVAGVAAGFTAAVTINGVDARSVLALMAKNFGAGSELTVEASGADAAEAVAAVVAEIAAAKG